MVGLSALWMPILVSAVFVLIALVVIHMLPGWHKSDMAAVPGEDKVMETLRGLNVQPGEYRFPYGNTTAEMTAPAFVEKMKAGPVGTMTIWPSGEHHFGKMIGPVVRLFAAHRRARRLHHGPYPRTGRAVPRSVPRERHGGVLLLCGRALAELDLVGQEHAIHAHVLVDGLVYALVTGATFGWLWPR